MSKTLATPQTSRISAFKQLSRTHLWQLRMSSHPKGNKPISALGQNCQKQKSFLLIPVSMNHWLRQVHWCQHDIVKYILYDVWCNLAYRGRLKCKQYQEIVFTGFKSNKQSISAYTLMAGRKLHNNIVRCTLECTCMYYKMYLTRITHTAYTCKDLTQMACTMLVSFQLFWRGYELRRMPQQEFLQDESQSVR